MANVKILLDEVVPEVYPRMTRVVEAVVIGSEKVDKRFLEHEVLCP